MDFDPYRKWLGISPSERPPNYYALLGLTLFEADPDAISNAADRQMSYLRQQQTGPHGSLTQQLLNELAAARLCLLNAAQKASYDASLKAKLAPVVVAAPIAVPLPAASLAPAMAVSVAPSIVPRPRGARGPSLSGSWAALPGWATPAACGLAAGLLLAWIAMWLGGGNPAAGAKPKPTAIPAGVQAAKPPGGDPSLVSFFQSIQRPSQLGVVAEKLVIWNSHNGPLNSVATLECNVRLLSGGREVWGKQEVAIPWAPNEDRSVALALPSERFDRVRVEITKWERSGGALAEIQVLSADGRNLAIGCPAIASGALNGRIVPEHVTDGMTTSALQDVGSWFLPNGMPGWIEVDLSLPRPTDLAGVTADQLVIWNQHNGPHNDRGSLECNVSLWAGGREVWNKHALALPWAPNEDRSLSLALPRERFDRVRIEVTKWQQNSGGLAEVQILRDNKNLALDCPAMAPATFDEWRSGIRVTDGIVNSAVEGVGYWNIWLQTPGWVEVDLGCLDAKYGAACRQLGLAKALLDGDWQRGLPWLARGDDRALRRLAIADSQDVIWDTQEELALADAWWELAQQAEGKVKQRLLARSLWRYRRVLDRLREYRKVQVESRIDQALPGLPERDYLYFMRERELKLGSGAFREVWPISVQGVRSPYGLLLHAVANGSSHTAFQLGKRYRRFLGAAAINDSAGGRTATELTFRVVADGRELWKSSPLKQTGSQETFDLDVAGIDKLELLVDCPGKHDWGHGVWIEPRCER